MGLVIKFILSVFLLCLSLSFAMSDSFDGGENFSLCLNEDGTVWAWGNNGYGQLGDGTTDYHLSPVQVSGLTDVISISAGSGHSLALKRDGTVWAWGWNYYGQLGDGTRSGDTPNPTPRQVLGLSGVIDISAGHGHSLAVRNDGTVWAWGRNIFGTLGDGTITDRSTPVQVVGFLDGVAVSGGRVHSVALKSDGTVWTWGEWYLIGLEDPSHIRKTPEQITGLTDVISISAGDSHGLALKKDGTIWAWEDNISNSVQSLVSSVIAIEAGAVFSIALTSYGTVWFWGSMELNVYEGDYISSIIPVPVEGISGVIAIGTGENHALAIKNDGTLWAWGKNWNGQLGDGTFGRNQSRRYPVQVKGFSTGGSASVPSSVLAADFDEDGKADPTAVNSAGQLFYWNSSQSFSRQGPIELGLNGVIVADNANAPDVDDAPPDMAVVEPGGLWIFFLSGTNGYSLHTERFSQTGTPLLTDFDGDRKSDPAIVSTNGTWHFWLSADSYSPVSAPFAISGATPVAADFDADGRADPVMVDANGNWYFYLSSYSYQLYGNRSYYFGVSGKPVAGDFDGDRRADPAMVDSSGNWNLFLSDRFYTRSGPWYLVLP